MEIFFEILFDIIIEGSLELGTSRKVPLPLRILAMLILLLVYGGLIAIFALIAVRCWKDGDILIAVVVSMLDVIVAVASLYAVRKMYKKKNNM